MMHAALGIWILSAVICVGRGDHVHGHQDTALDDSTSSVSLVAAANKEFAYRLYSQLAAHADSQGKNIFFSPSSISVALAALSVGAREETHRQLFSGLGFNSTLLTQADVDQAFHTLLEAANATSGEDTSEGTVVFVDDNFKPRPEFLETLKQSYHADGFTVDFAKAADSANTINEYVKEKTNGKIEDLVKDVDPMTVMYLISYIYYKGKWATPFKPVFTREDTFTVDETTKVKVQMMNEETRFDVYYDQAINTSVLHLPFNSSYSMLLMLPDDMATLERAVCPSHVTKWLKRKKSRQYDVYLPKFSIKTSYTLNDVLTRMGMTDMFSKRADLSGIAEDKNLTVSEVVHQATLDVDEAGTTASAATGVWIVPFSGSLYSAPVLKFDRPFMVMILERSTEEILFMGKIVNPTI
ncbi:Hibernation-specific plasma protein HP-55 [Nibea albiflora]|uniref:Hibernation-specific plasma protein HP-55 n=1 Tax=Nibea albiflora TaxID=240163 RepID=A0ACB7FD80_NIBAL|nr:Hibernation-specific plasma protein HP-55 [Nibea albiflora]